MLRGILLHNGIVERFQCCVGGCLGHHPLRLPAFPPTPHHHVPLYSPCHALAMLGLSSSRELKCRTQGFRREPFLYLATCQYLVKKI